MSYAICSGMDDDGLMIPWDLFTRYYVKVRKSGALVVTDENGRNHYYVCGSLNGTDYVWTWFDMDGHVERFETIAGDREAADTSANGREMHQEKVLVYERFPYDIERIPDPDMPEGCVICMQNGITGLAQTEYLVTYVDGVDVSWDFVESQYIIETQEQIIIYGTKKGESVSPD